MMNKKANIEIEGITTLLLYLAVAVIILGIIIFLGYFLFDEIGIGTIFKRLR